ncbi:MAG: lactate permease LctP family transporter [Candidatus Pacebacteria bacterium]|nr:lactate permease LctP family transporter [Candidatus Paceibacterota bacterium]
MWYQAIDPLHNVILSAGAAVIPIIILFILLLSRKVAGHIATLLTLAIGLIIAVTVYAMPVSLAGMSALYGVLNGLFPIGWIVLCAVFLYNISVKSGSFEVVRDSIESVTADRRLQALLIAFCFGAFLEGAAGFGAPVAITAAMLVGLGFDALYAAGICLIANTAPVAFGGIGIAVITAGHLTNIDPNILSQMIAHQLPFIAFIIPLWLVLIVSGWKGAKEIWPAVLVTGGSYALTMFLVASYLGPTLPDILSSIVSILCLICLFRFWHPKNVWRFPKERTAIPLEQPIRQKHGLGDLVRAWTPFLLLIIFVGNWGIPGIQTILGKVTAVIPFGILDGSIISNGSALPISYSFAWLGAAGTAILFAAIIAAILARLSWKDFWQTAFQTLRELYKPLITIGSIVGFAYVANYSGMSVAIGNALTLTGRSFPFLAPLLGWFGVFVTGSDTSSNALFSTIQSQTARSLGISPVLTVASNSSGGVAAKMISPQSIAVAAAASKLTGEEGKLFRFTILHSVGLVLIICSIAFTQAYYFPWMIPAVVAAASTASAGGISVGECVIAAVSVLAILALAAFSRQSKSDVRSRA